MGRIVRLLGLLILTLVGVAEAYDELPTGVRPWLSYVEPSTNTDGSALTNLAEICAYWRVDVGLESKTCLPASSASGGASVTNKPLLDIVPILPGQKKTFQTQIVARAQTGIESGRSPQASLLVDRLAQVPMDTIPPPAPGTPTPGAPITGPSLYPPL